jgi:hypothetical protein
MYARRTFGKQTNQNFNLTNNVQQRFGLPLIPRGQK